MSTKRTIRRWCAAAIPLFCGLALAGCQPPAVVESPERSDPEVHVDVEREPRDTPVLDALRDRDVDVNVGPGGVDVDVESR